MMHFLVLISGLICCAGATYGQNRIIYLIPDASGSDTAKIAFDNSLNFALELFNQSDQALLFAEGFRKQYLACTQSDAQLVVDSLRQSQDGVQLFSSENVSVRSFQAALDQFERKTGLDLLDKDKPGIDFHVVVAGDVDRIFSENLLSQNWFEPVFRQNGWPSPILGNEGWPSWLFVNHRFDVNNSGINHQIP